MKPSNEQDNICIDKIIIYIQTINNAYKTFTIHSANELANNDICRLAVTQAITNIHELKKRIQPETFNKMPMFKGINLKAARNLASHDYDRLDFDVIYKRTRQLLQKNIFDELEAAKHDTR